MQCSSCQAQVNETQRFCPECGTLLASANAAGGAEGRPADPMIGQTLGGKYKVIKLLGEGGMGAVYEGEQQLGTTTRKVAVKTLHTHLSHDAKVKARFEREVGTIAELEHPNTIQVYDFGTTPAGILYIVMEFLHGKSLADLLEKQGAMPPERADHVLQQVCGSLEEAHGRGIVHRDLKPDNIVLVERAGKKDFVKVLDFGIAKRAKEVDQNEQKLTQQGMVLGTPPYMSPEQFTGQPIDARSDIYSLGVMAYEMLTGRLPFSANTAWEWATAHMTQPPIPIESLAEGMRAPPAMRAAIQRALAKSPNDRFQTVAELGETFAGRAPLPVGTGTAPVAASAPKQKTELGTPLDVAAAFGGAAPSGAMGIAPPPMTAPHAYTPTSGNVSFPTPAAIPHPPEREASGGGRKALLVAAGLIGIASIGAIVFAMKGGSTGSPPKEVVFDNSAAQPAPDTSLTPTIAPTPPADFGPAKMLPLNGAPAVTPHAVPHPTSSHAQEPAQPPPSLPQPPLPPQPAPTPAAGKYDGPECQRARRLRAMDRPREAQTWALACIAKGGTP